MKKNSEVFNEICHVLLHYETESGDLLQDVLKKEIHGNFAYTEIFDIVEAIECELNKNFNIKRKKK